MTFADILEKVGSFGKFQIQLVLLLGFPVLLLASHNLLQNFLAVVPDHHCRVRLGANGSVNATPGPLTREELLRVLIPLDGDGRPEKCREYSSPQWHLLDPNATGLNATEAETRACAQGWEYDDSRFKASIVTAWDLVCGNRALRQLAQSVYMGGVLVGSIVLGWLSDRFGRRNILLWSHFQLAVSGTCGGFSTSYPLFCCWRFLCGMALSGVILSTFCLSLEWNTTHTRTAIFAYYNYCYTIGQLLLAGIAYGIRDWRWLQTTVAAPFYIFFLYSWWFPESARWLILNDKTEAALKHLKRVAKLNGQVEEGEKLTSVIIKSTMEKELSNVKSTYTILDLFKTPIMCKTAYCTMLIWFSTSFAYYGLAMDLQGFGVDIYLIQVIFGAVDIPAKFFGVLSLSYMGRRFTQGASLILAGSIIIINSFVPHDLTTLRTSLAVVGKGCLATAFSCCYLYAGELYPTVVRQTALGLVTTMARLGAMIAPVVKMIGDSVSFLPMVIYGGMAFFSGTSTFLLRETLNLPLPDTIEDVEGRAKSRIEKEESPKKDEVPLRGTGTSLMGQSV